MIDLGPPPAAGSRREYEEDRIDGILAKTAQHILCPPLSFAKQLQAAGVNPDSILAPDFPVALLLSKVEPPSSPKISRWSTAELVGVHAVVHLVLDNGGKQRYYALFFCGRTEASRARAEMLLKTDVGHGTRMYIAEQGPSNINIEPDPIVVHAPALREMMRRSRDPSELVASGYCPACAPGSPPDSTPWAGFWAAP